MGYGPAQTAHLVHSTLAFTGIHRNHFLIADEADAGGDFELSVGVEHLPVDDPH